MRSLLPVAFLLAACAAEAEPPARGTPPLPVRACINMGNALEAPNEGEWGPVLTRSDFQAIAAEGFDTIRLPVRWSAHADARGGIDPAFQARVDEVIRWAMDEGLRVIVNVHHYRELETDADAHIPRLLAIWDTLAAHYADWPPTLVFEAVNEPSGSFTQAKVNAFNADVLARIRQTNPTRWVVLGGAHWGSVEPFRSSARPGMRVTDDPYVMATFHSYAPFEWTHQGVTFMDEPPPAGRALTRDDLAEFREEMAVGNLWSRTHQVPVLLGEFGPYIRTIPQAERAAWTANARKSAEANGLGWCFWDWQGEFRYADPDTHIPLPGMREALFGR